MEWKGRGCRGLSGSYREMKWGVLREERTPETSNTTLTTDGRNKQTGQSNKRGDGIR